MPCVRVLNIPSPQERRKLPSRSKTITGCSLRLKTYTLSLESTATPATSMNSQPDGSFSQFSTGVKSSIPLPTTVAIMCLLMSEKSGAVPNNDGIIAQKRTLDQPVQTAYDSVPSHGGLQPREEVAWHTKDRAFSWCTVTLLSQSTKKSSMPGTTLSIYRNCSPYRAFSTRPAMWTRKVAPSISLPMK